METMEVYSPYEDGPIVVDLLMLIVDSIANLVILETTHAIFTDIQCNCGLSLGGHNDLGEANLGPIY